MQFRTQIPIPKSDRAIDYSSRMLSLGSCFAVNMAEKFDYFQFRNSVNPFGILFHPKAIEKLLDFAVSGKQFGDDELFFHNERWHCFDAHSDLSHSDKNQLSENLNTAIAGFSEQLSKASHILITYGTAWVYREKISGNLVANCHKIPQHQFEKEILSVEIIRESILNTIVLISRFNPNAKIIFTVSPVRHIKDGFVENQRSKANLISAIHEIVNSKSSIATYFPSYEIVMDELRDYRFYAEDMIHPNQTAIDYIWEKFSESSISESAFPIMEKITNIRKSLSHRPFNPDSESHKKFTDRLDSSISALQKQFPHMRF